MKRIVRCKLDTLSMFYHRDDVLSPVKMSVPLAAGLHGLRVISVVRECESGLGNWLGIVRLPTVQVKNYLLIDLASNLTEQVSRQSEPCSLDRNCAIIKVTWEPWSTCQFLSTSDQCGSGFQVQAANCYVGANFTVHSDCKLSKPTRIRTCSVDCDQDCIASEWTPWR